MRIAPLFDHHLHKEIMDTDLCIGILTKNDILELAVIERGKAMVAMTFPASRMGMEALRGFLASHSCFIRLAVAGAASLSVALALGNVSGREAFIVSSTGADQAIALAYYAEHAF
jgi:hypothetical protein